MSAIFSLDQVLSYFYYVKFRDQKKKNREEENPWFLIREHSKWNSPRGAQGGGGFFRSTCWDPRTAPIGTIIHGYTATRAGKPQNKDTKTQQGSLRLKSWISYEDATFWCRWIGKEESQPGGVAINERGITTCKCKLCTVVCTFSHIYINIYMCKP